MLSARLLHARYEHMGVQDRLDWERSRGCGERLRDCGRVRTSAPGAHLRLSRPHQEAFNRSLRRRKRPLVQPAGAR